MDAPTDWGSAIAILAAGLILGVLFVFYFNRRKAAKLGGEPDLELKDLQAKRDALVQRLRDLGENAPAEERRRLELETADVLRQLDEHKTPETGHGAPAVPVNAINPAVKGFLWGAASVAALAGLAWFVMNSAAPREEGGMMTGGIESPQSQQAAQPVQTDPMIQQLEAAVRNDPSNLQLRNDLAQAYLERDNLMGVFEQTKFVLEKAPNDSRALVFQGLVRMAMGETDGAMQMLRRASESDPKNLDAWVARAWMHTQQDQLVEAEKMIAEASRQSPNDRQKLEELFAQMKAHAAQLRMAQQNGGMPAGHPPVDQAPSAAAAAPNDGRSISVTLDLDEAATLKNGVVYVMARPPAGGPPVAVKRLQVTSFPVTFELGSADSMLGQPLPDSFRLEARLDSDGDAATKRPTDPSALQDGVAPGAKVRMALK